MRERLEQLGWQDIEVEDEDLGRSAAGTVTVRPDHQRINIAALFKFRP